MTFTFYPTIEIPIKAKDEDEAQKIIDDFIKQFNNSVIAKDFHAKKIIDGELE